VIFNPSEEVMYPLRGNLQDLSQKRGVEVDVKGWGDVMEGASRRKSLRSPRQNDLYF
jgi:pantoate--beta-alanine ligase